MTARTRRVISSLIRLLVVVGAIAWLAHDPSRKWKWHDLWHTVMGADRRFLLLAWLSYGPTPVFLAMRLRWLLVVHDIRLTAWQVIRATFAGNFLTWASPVGTSGGDTAKAVFIAKDTPHKHEAVMTVFFDRLIGVISLVLLSGAMVLLNWHNPALARWGRLIGVLALVFFGGATVYFSHTLRAWFRVDWILSVLPLGHHLKRIDNAVLAFRSRGKRVLGALGFTITLQGAAIVSTFLAGWALGLVGDRPAAAFPIYLTYLPICFLAGALPLGFMEVAYKELFSGAAHLGTPEAAVTLALLSRLFQLVWALPGALVLLRTSSSSYSADAIRQVEAELDSPMPVPSAPGTLP